MDRDEMTEVRPTSPVESGIETLNELQSMLAKRLDELTQRLGRVIRPMVIEDRSSPDNDRAARSTLVMQLDELAERTRDRIADLERILASLEV